MGCKPRYNERMFGMVLQEIFGHLRNISDGARRHSRTCQDYSDLPSLK